MWRLGYISADIRLVARRLQPLFPEEYYAWAPNAVVLPSGSLDAIYRLVSGGVNKWDIGGFYYFPHGTVRFPWLFQVAPDVH